MRKFLIGFVLLTAALTAGCLQTTRMAGEGACPTPSKIDRRDGVLSAIADQISAAIKDGFSGAVLMTRAGNPVLCAANGDAGPSGVFTVDTPIDIASISKPATSMAILKLAERGKLSIDDPLSRWFPEVPAGKAKITLRQMITHVSGLVDIPVGMTDYTPIDQPQMARKILEAPLEFTPGAKWSYSNGGFNLLGIIVEKASGRSLFDFLQTEVFTPAGVMASYDPSQFLRVADAKMETGWTDLRSSAAAAKGPFWGLWGAGGVFMSARDLSRFMDAYLAGRIVSPRSVQLGLTPSAELDEHNHEGLVWSIIDTRRKIRIYYYNGGSEHSNTELRYFPDLKLTLAVVTNHPPKDSHDLAASKLARQITAIISPPVK